MLSWGPVTFWSCPKVVEHCPKASDVCQLLLIEPFGTPNTGDAGGQRTAPEERLGEGPVA
jgi:hypothetical protein